MLALGRKDEVYYTHMKLLVQTRERAFTLIELLVVIAIIGLLSSVALVATGPSRAKARDAKRQADIRQIASAMEFCYDDKACAGGNAQQYPLISSATGPTKITGYLDPMPKEPSTGLDYSWSTNAGAQSKYCVYVKLEVPSTTTYFAASEKGINTALGAQPPSALGTCW